MTIASGCNFCISALLRANDSVGLIHKRFKQKEERLLLVVAPSKLVAREIDESASVWRESHGWRDLVAT